MDEYFVRYFDFCVTGLIAFRPIFKRWSQRPTDRLCPIMRLCQQIYTVCASFKRYIIRKTHTYACVCVDVNSWVRSPCVSHPITEPQIDDNYELLCGLWSPVVGTEEGGGCRPLSPVDSKELNLYMYCVRLSLFFFSKHINYISYLFKSRVESSYEGHSVAHWYKKNQNKSKFRYV